MKEFQITITVDESNTYEVLVGGEDVEAAMNQVEVWAQNGQLGSDELLSRSVASIQIESAIEIDEIEELE